MSDKIGGIPFRVCMDCGVFLEYRKRQRKCPVCQRTFGTEGSVKP